MVLFTCYQGTDAFLKNISASPHSRKLDYADNSRERSSACQVERVDLPVQDRLQWLLHKEVPDAACRATQAVEKK
jgi:hypothetical protein